MCRKCPELLCSAGTDVSKKDARIYRICAKRETKYAGAVKRLESLVLSDLRKVNEITDTAGLVHAAVHKVITQNVEMSKV